MTDRPVSYPDLTITEREAAPEERKRGRGKPSSPRGLWRVFDFTGTTAMRVHCTQGRVIEVVGLKEWEQVPEEGVLVVRTPYGSRRGGDEYRYRGKAPRYGLTVSDNEMMRTLKLARPLVHPSGKPADTKPEPAPEPEKVKAKEANKEAAKEPDKQPESKEAEAKG